MQVIATAVGYDGVAVRQPGDVFDMPDGASGPWFKLAADDTKESPKAKTNKSKADPDAFA